MGKYKLQSDPYLYFGERYIEQQEPNACCCIYLTKTFKNLSPKLETNLIIPEPTARNAVRRGLLIPHGYLHPGKCEHSEVQR